MRQPFYVLVCGGRDYTNKRMLGSVLHGVLTDRSIYDSDTHRMVIVHGNAKGADTLAANWASVWDCPVFTVPAEWARFGKQAAGPMRNAQMLKWLDVSLVVAFPGGSGTKDMVERATRAGIPVTQVFEDF